MTVEKSEQTSIQQIPHVHNNSHNQEVAEEVARKQNEVEHAEKEAGKDAREAERIQQDDTEKGHNVDLFA